MIAPGYRYVCALAVLAVVGCVGPDPSYNVSLGLDLPKVVERGQVIKANCLASGSEAGRLTIRWYTGKVEVEFECPEGIEVRPARLELEMRAGESHNKATEEVTITVHPDAALGKHSITLTGKKSDGKGTLPETLEIEVREASHTGAG